MGDLLAGKTAVITGGASGIGRGIAVAMAEHGADVVIADLRETPRTENEKPTVKAIEKKTDSTATFVKCDVSSEEDLIEAVSAAGQFGGIDIMVNNAGILHPVDFFETSPEDFDSVIDVNLKGAFFGSKAAAEVMTEKGEGSIINVASTAAEQGFVEPGSMLYIASKGGLRSLTFGLAEQLGPDIRVNAILPGFIGETGLSANHPDELLKERAKETSLGRLGFPDDVGNAAVFLASDLASYVTAETLLVDGGWVHVGGP